MSILDKAGKIAGHINSAAGTALGAGMGAASEGVGALGKVAGKTLEGAARIAKPVDELGGKAIDAAVKGAGMAIGGAGYAVGKTAWEGAKLGAKAAGAIGKGAYKAVTSDIAKKGYSKAGDVAVGASTSAANGALEFGRSAAKLMGEGARIEGPGAEWFNNSAASRVIGNLGNPIGMAASMVKKAGQLFIDFEKGGPQWDAKAKKVVDKSMSISLNKKGIAAVTGALALSDSVNTYQEASAKTMGTIDNSVTKATPDYQPQQYSRTVGTMNDHAGATGDLVFALFKNRGRSAF